MPRKKSLQVTSHVMAELTLSVRQPKSSTWTEKKAAIFIPRNLLDKGADIKFKGLRMMTEVEADVLDEDV